MNAAYGALPEALWGLCRSADELAPRGFVVSDLNSSNAYRSRYLEHQEGLDVDDQEGLEDQGRYPIVSVRIKRWERENPLVIIAGVTVVTVEDREFNNHLELGGDVEDLKFVDDTNFNKPITLPVSLKTVVFGRKFNEPVDLPPFLLSVRFGKDFNQPLSLSPRLAELYFQANNGRFNYALTLPDTLKVLQLSAAFNWPIALPAGLEDLRIDRAFDQVLTFPLGLKALRLSNPCVLAQRLDLDDSLPSSLQYLDLGGYGLPVAFPNNLVGLDLGKHLLEIDLPQSLRELKVGLRCKPRNLPSGLKVLDWRPDQPVNLQPLELLKKLYLGDTFQQEIDLPEGLEELTFLGRYAHPLHHLPASLKRLQFKDVSPPLRRYPYPLNLPKGCVRIDKVDALL